MKRKTIGRAYIISFAWAPPCCGALDGCVNLLERSWLATISSGRARSAVQPTSGRANPKLTMDSGTDRSGIQPGMNMAPRSSKWLLRRLYKAKKTGICRSRGRQPERGLTFSRLYNAAISWFILSGLSLRRARISAILGLRDAIFAIDSELLKVSGRNTSLVT